MLFPRGGVMQMRQASRFVPPSQRNFGAIYADVEQNGWSDLVICESSRGERNESLDVATRPCLLPAFWMTSCLFIPLDSRHLLTGFLFFVCLLLHFPFALSRLPFTYVFTPCFPCITWIFLFITFFFWSSINIKFIKKQIDTRLIPAWENTLRCTEDPNYCWGTNLQCSSPVRLLNTGSHTEKWNNTNAVNSHKIY